MALLNDDNQQEEAELPKISVTATGKGGYWAGMSAGEFKSIYRDLHALGTLSGANYIVELEPYQPDSLIANIAWFTEATNWLPWLATSCNLPLMEAQVDSVQAGHYQQNFITGNATGDIQLTFLETMAGDILFNALSIRDIMFKEDGIQALPCDYMMWMTISLYPNYNRGVIPFQQQILVALQSSSVELAASNPNPIEVPLTFTRMFPMIR